MVGKAVIKELRRRYPESNIVAVDYDPGASEVNQLNRIKLMISVAKENFRTNREGGFRLENPSDPVTNEAVAPYTGSTRFEDSVARGDGSACGVHGGSIELTDEQLAQIEEAKRRAGVTK